MPCAQPSDLSPTPGPPLAIPWHLRWWHQRASTVVWFQGTATCRVCRKHQLCTGVCMQGHGGVPADIIIAAGLGCTSSHHENVSLCLQLIRATIQAFTNVTPPDAPPPPRIEAYGEVALTQQGSLLGQVAALVPGVGIYSKTPLPMEEYGQQ